MAIPKATVASERSVARIWLNESGGAVQIVLVLAFNKRAQQFWIEKWERGALAGEPRVRAQNVPDYEVARATAVVKISRSPAGNFMAFDGLMIEFEKVLLR